MSDREKLVPEIRFKGYTNAWEQRKLGEVAKFSKGNGYSKADLTDSGTPIILYGRLYTNYETVIRSVETFANVKEQSVISLGGEVIVPSSGETSEDISRASVIEQKGIILGGDLNIVMADSMIKPTFLALTISNGKQQKELSKRAQGKSVVHLNNSDLKEIRLLFPEVPEQTAIGNFFRTIDAAITLHQRKLNGLRELKKGYLQQMFPQADERVPRVRFAGFSDEWQERRLGDVADVRDGTHDSPKFYDNGYPLVTSKNLSDSGLDLSDVSLISEDDFEAINKRSKVDIGDILFGMIGTIGTPVIVDRSGFAIKNVALIKEGIEVLNSFLIHLFKSHAFDKYIGLENVGGTQKFLGLSKIRNFVFLAPSVFEQCKIGNFFRSLDKQISAQATKLAHIKNLKTAYLNKMFI